MLKVGVNDKVSNKDYHADKTHLSSSDLKLILKSSQQFYTEKILGQKIEEEKPAFIEGSYVHSLILEPEKVEEEYAFFEGWRKQGKEYEAFKELNKSKTILSQPQKHRCSKYFDGYNQRPEAKEILSQGLPEHTMCTSILGVPLKVRCDYINIEKGYIADVKTTGHESSLDIFKMVVEEYMYQLSASLYCQVAKSVYSKDFDFYFVVISKADYECHIYKASTSTLISGHMMVNKAIMKYKRCLESNNWTNDFMQSKIITGNYEILEV